PYGGAAQVGAGAASHLPAAVQGHLAQAAVTGFHDTVWFLVILSALGLGAALLLHNPRGGMASLRAAQVADRALRMQIAPVRRDLDPARRGLMVRIGRAGDADGLHAARPDRAALHGAERVITS